MNHSADEQERHRLQRFGHTIAIFLLVVLTCVVAHYLIFQTNYNNAFSNYGGFGVNGLGPFFEGPIITLIVLGPLALTAIVAGIIGADNFGLLFWTINPTNRQLLWLLRGLGLFAGVGLAVICYFSGGTTDSPFLPLLLIYGFIAVVFADHWLTKGLLGFGPVLPYVFFYNQAFDAAYALPRSMFTGGWGAVSATSIVLISIGLTFLTYQRSGGLNASRL